MRQFRRKGEVDDSWGYAADACEVHRNEVSLGRGVGKDRAGCRLGYCGSYESQGTCARVESRHNFP
jgi:hypothetical protein